MAILSEFIVKLLKATLVYCIVTIVLSAIQLTDSQLDTSNDNSSNESTLDPACIDTEGNCSSLPPVCIMCNLSQDGLPYCNYTFNTTFSCTPLDNVTCKVSLKAISDSYCCFFIVLSMHI